MRICLLAGHQRPWSRVQRSGKSKRVRHGGLFCVLISIFSIFEDDDCSIIFIVVGAISQIISCLTFLVAKLMATHLKPILLLKEMQPMDQPQTIQNLVHLIDLRRSLVAVMHLDV